MTSNIGALSGSADRGSVRAESRALMQNGGRGQMELFRAKGREASAEDWHEFVRGADNRRALEHDFVIF